MQCFLIPTASLEWEESVEQIKKTLNRRKASTNASMKYPYPITFTLRWLKKNKLLGILLIGHPRN